MRRGDVPEAVRHAARLNYEAGRADALAGRTDEWAIELHYLSGDDGWRLWTDAGWPRPAHGREGSPFPYADRAEAERSLEYVRRGYGNEGKDWARLVRRTVTPWTQVED
jgi:hypothetical protein